MSLCGALQTIFNVLVTQINRHIIQHLEIRVPPQKNNFQDVILIINTSRYCIGNVFLESLIYISNVLYFATGT